MRVPELAYRLARDPASSGPMIELFSRDQVISASSTTVLATFNGPAKDRVLVLTNIGIELVPGATQAATRANIGATTAAMLGFTIKMETFLVDADERQTADWQGEIWIGGGGTDNTILRVSCDFDAGVNANAIQVGVFGFVIPRGNVAPF